MTQTPQQLQSQYQAETEWESAFLAYRAAQARMAHAGAFMAVTAWAEMVRPTSFVASLSRWLDFVTRIVRGFRARQRRLTQAYYQYGRALDIGETFGSPLNGRAPTLAGYRDSFLDQLHDASLIDQEAPANWDAEDGMDEIRQELQEMLAETEGRDSQREANFRDIDLDDAIQRFIDTWESIGDEIIEVEDLEWPDRDADNADQVHRDTFRQEALEAWQEQERGLDRDEALEDEEDADRQSIADRLEAASRRAGNKVAGRVMAATTHAADQVTNWAMDRDHRVYGVARGTGPNPCALCAIAASRGFAYSSVSSAMTTRSGGRFTRYHDNCQCYPIIRWTPTQAEPESTRRWRAIYDSVKSQPGDTFNNFRRRVHAETKGSVNARRRRWYEQNKDSINARRRARRRS